MDRNRLSKLRKLTQVLAILVAMLFMVSCTGEPQKPADIQGDGYAYTKEWATWYITNKLIKNGKVPSVVIALVDDQEVVWQEAFGYADLEEQVFASADTIYRMGSISKPFTALAIMKLYEDGIIDLDAPITDYLPDFSLKTRFPDSDPITIRSILSHRSGLPVGSIRWLIENSGIRDYERISLKELVDFLPDEYVSYPVGYRYQYSNLGFTILGRIIEVVTGSEFTVYMQENILNPLGMGESSFLSSPAIKGKMGMGYYTDQSKAEPHPQLDYSDLPPANLYSTLSDMAKFVSFLFGEGEVNDKQIIQKETLEMMYVDYYSRPRDPCPLGLSWGLYSLSSGHIMVVHGGSVAGFEAFMGFLPNEKLGFVIVANLTGATLTNPGAKVLELMLESKYGIKPIEETIPETVHVDKTTLERYVGKYNTIFTVFDIILKNDTLQMPIPLGLKSNLIPISETQFRFPTPIQKLIKALIGLKMTMEFLIGNDTEEDIMILKDNFGFCYVSPKVSEIEGIPPLWNELAGKYTLEPYYSEETFGKFQINIVDNVLTADLTSDIIPGPLTLVLNPINDTEILTVGGFWGGETISYDSDTGYLSWAGIIAKPIE